MNFSHFHKYTTYFSSTLAIHANNGYYGGIIACSPKISKRHIVQATFLQKI